MADDGDYFSRVKIDLLRMKQFLISKKLIINAHNVDFFTQNLWETSLPQEVRDDLDELTIEEIASLPSKCIQWIEQPDALTIGTLKRCANLLNLFSDIRSHHLKTLPYVLKSEYFEGMSDDSVLTSFMMSPKKSYEVGVMSQAVFDLVHKTKAMKVVDLGSGKGYLSQYLSLHYGINVVGIDSSDSNTKNAEKRNQKTLKIWHFLLKKANSQSGVEKTVDRAAGQQKISCSYHNHQATNSCKNDSICCNCEQVIDNHSSSPDSDKTTKDQQTRSTIKSVEITNEGCSDLMNLTSESNNSSTYCETCTASKDFSHQRVSVMTCRNDSSERCSTSKDLASTHLDVTNGDKQCAEDDLTRHKKDSKSTIKNNTTYNITDDDIKTSSNDVSLQSGSDIDNHQDNQQETEQIDAQLMKHNSYQPLTKFVSTEVKIVEQLGSLLDNDSNEGLVLVGLHTCGDLAPTAIKIFLNDCHVKALCLVGCCYHLLSQSTATESSEDGDYGFPVSEYLRKENYRISRNATMVAQQAADRLASACKVPPKSIFYRAVLQVILKERFGLDTTGMHVGRIGAKCKTFEEYVHKSFKKLGLPIDEITPEDIDSFYQRFEPQERKIMSFHQLRACIAPCIESLFLIDRLCFLLEQGVNDARIVALFDPVKSPRSYAIIASKLQ